MAKAVKSTFSIENTKNQSVRRRRRNAREFYFPVRGLILGIIVVNVFIVIGVVIFSFYMNPERRVVVATEDLAKNYYENIFYENLITSENFNGDFDDALTKYSTRGLARMTLRQLILIEDVDQNTAGMLEEYCDTGDTVIIFYPDQPFSRTDYHYDINYSCEYE